MTTQLEKVLEGNGFIAALDQSGGSTPKALAAYGVAETEYNSDEEMFDLVHEMRTRIVTTPSFTGNKVMGVILFENTIDKTVNGLPTAQYVWEEKHIVPFLKVDKGLADEENGVQLMKDIPNLDATLTKAKEKHIFGTKMRSVINEANEDGIKAIVEQQFAIGKQIVQAGLVPIIEPEVNINCPQKQEAEIILKKYLLEAVNKLNEDEKIMLKLTLPSEANFYKELIDHKNVLQVVALSGGYSRADSVEKLSQNDGMLASFSRAFTQGLSKNLTDEEFDTAIKNSIDLIYNASVK